jgi:DNA-nicking Smr family endonuclease
MSRRRPLSEEERALWRGFVRTITPLEPARDVADLDQPLAADRPAPPQPPQPPRPPAQQQDSPARKAPPLSPLGRRLKQRVARGREAIDARLDLHGFTQQRAHAALLGFLHRAQADGVRIALVVTGKGTSKGTGKGTSTHERGVLKRQVPLWLSLPEFRSLVIGFEDAHIGHGGDGALYVRLRRARR